MIMKKEKNDKQEGTNAFQQVNESITDSDEVKPVSDEKVEDAIGILNLDKKNTSDRG